MKKKWVEGGNGHGKRKVKSEREGGSGEEEGGRRGRRPQRQSGSLPLRQIRVNNNIIKKKRVEEVVEEKEEEGEREADLGCGDASEEVGQQLLPPPPPPPSPPPSLYPFLYRLNANSQNFRVASSERPRLLIKLLTGSDKENVIGLTQPKTSERFRTNSIDLQPFERILFLLIFAFSSVQSGEVRLPNVACRLAIELQPDRRHRVERIRHYSNLGRGRVDGYRVRPRPPKSYETLETRSISIRIDHGDDIEIGA